MIWQTEVLQAEIHEFDLTNWIRHSVLAPLAFGLFTTVTNAEFTRRTFSCTADAVARDRHPH